MCEQCDIEIETALNGLVKQLNEKYDPTSFILVMMGKAFELSMAVHGPETTRQLFENLEQRAILLGHKGNMN